MASRAIDVPAKPHLRVVRDDERIPWTERVRSRLRRLTRAEERTRSPAVVLVLLAATGLLAAIGLVMVLSASSVAAYAQYGSSFLFFKRQAVYAVAGTGALLITSHVRYRAWQRLWLPLMVATIGLLMLVLRPGVGTVAGGSARWIQLGPSTIQPSEFAKLAVVLFAAAILVRKWKVLNRPLHLIIPLAPVLAVVCGLILLQPDLGTAVLLVATVLAVLFVAGIRLRHMVAAVAVSAGTAALFVMSHPYQRARFLSFLHPWQDPTNKGYQLIQSLIGLGSGGWFGVGLGASRQKWMYIPNAHTDFIFSILGEELGLIGELVVLALFGMLIYSGIRVAVRSPDTFGRLLASGIVAWIGIQTLVNLGAVTGLLPITGVPLPFVSFGGSSLVVSMAAVGILVNIGRTPAPARAAPGDGDGRAGAAGPGKRAPAKRKARRRR